MIFPWTKPAPKKRRPSASKSRRRPPARQARRPERRDPRDLVEGLEQRHYDVIGLFLIAAAVFMAFVLYLGWDGGRVGHWVERGLANGFGQVAYVVPIALAAWGAALIARPSIEAPSALNAGGVLILAGLLLAFAAETAGIGPDRPNRHDYFEQKYMLEHGGVIGESLYWASTSLFQRLGAHILVLLMFVSGALLLTQTTLASLLARTGSAVRSAGTRGREVAQTVRTQRLAKSGGAEPDLWGDAPGDEIAVTRAHTTETFAVEPDEEPEEAAETVVLEDGDPEWAAPDEEPDEFAYSANEPTQPALVDVPDDGPVTPMGKRRSKDGVTESDEIAYRPPPMKALEKGKADPGPDMKDRDATANALLESLRHFGVEARLLGVVSGPHVSRYELQLAPGNEGLQRSPSSRTTSPTHLPQRTSGSSRRSPARRPSASRCRISAAVWSASATSTAIRRRARHRFCAGSARTFPARPSAPTSP